VLSAATTGTGSQTVLSLSYDFHLGVNDNGNVYAILNNRVPERTQAFSYDALNRLSSVTTLGTDCTVLQPSQLTMDWGDTFSYDAWGNLLAKTPSRCTAETLDVTVNAKNQISNTGFCYDSAGNLLGQTNCSTYVYDAENRLKQTAGVTYTYDGDGERVEKSSGVFYWGGSGTDALAESDASGTVNHEYIFFNSKRIAKLDLPGGVVSYYFSDHLGSSNVMTDAAGTIRGESDFYPFGGERTVLADATANHYKFTGKERDGESGLDEFGARYYSSALGRFTIPDWAAKPVSVPYADFGNPQSLNLYAYVGNNPLLHADLDGHCWPLSACVAAVNNFFDRAVQKNTDMAAKVGGPAAAAAVSFQAGVGASAVKMLTSPLTVGSATGSCMGGSGCSAGGWAKAVGGDALKAAAIAAPVAGVLAKAAGALTGTAEATSTAETAQALAGRAEQIHGALDPIAQNMRTTAVANVTNADGTASTLVSSSRNALAPAQRAVLQEGEAPVSGAGHAEETILNAAQQNGQAVNAMGVSRTPCPSCAQKLDAAGVTVSGPR